MLTLIYLLILLFELSLFFTSIVIVIIGFSKVMKHYFSMFAVSLLNINVQMDVITQSLQLLFIGEMELAPVLAQL